MQELRYISDSVYRKIKEHFPWLVAEWNGVEWESERTLTRRRLSAIEAHFRNLEDRYADLENRLLDHSQGRKHTRPRVNDVLPEPDKE